MIELMFATAVAGMVTAEASPQGSMLPIDYRLSEETAAESRADWRKWIGPDYSFEDERDCPVFFQKDIAGFGSMRLNSACTRTKDDVLWP